MLEAILLPSQEIADEYASYAIETDDGTRRVRTHRARDRRLAGRASPRHGRDAASKSKRRVIVERHRLAVSNMPEGTVNVLEKEQVLDLLAYLLSGSNAPPAAEPRAGQ